MSNVGKAVRRHGSTALFRACISDADQGGVDDGWVEMLDVIRCLRANIVDKNLGKGESRVTGAACTSVSYVRPTRRRLPKDPPSLWRKRWILS